MKFKTTTKAIRNEGGKIVSIGYCGAQHLLRYEEERAYTCGVYGWNYDVYCIDGVTVCTGYRGMPGQPVDYAILNEYETQAEKIVYNNKIPYAEQRNKVRALLREMLANV